MNSLWDADVSLFSGFTVEFIYSFVCVKSAFIRKKDKFTNGMNTNYSETN